MLKKVSVIIIFFLGGMGLALGQSVQDPIVVEKVSNNYVFSQNGQRLSMSQLVLVLKPNEMAYAQIKSAKSSYGFAQVLAYAGGFMVGYPLGTALGGGEPNWTMAGIGAGLIVVAIPLSKGASNKAKQAVDMYNEGLPPSVVSPTLQLNLSMTGSGLGLTLNF